MCLIVVAWQAHPDFPLVVAANRDEFFARPTAAAALWDDAPGLLAGRDLQAGGTWLGLAKTGAVTPGWRFSALTNFRHPASQFPDARSRGELPTHFLASRQPAGEFAAELMATGTTYGGFNLLTANLSADGRGELAYCHNLSPLLGNQAPPSPQILTPGIHAVSNSVLDTPWPKLQQARAEFAHALEDLPDSVAFSKAALGLLADQQRAADAELPATGVPLKWERILSSIFVHSPDYGTRASTLLWIDRHGQANFREVTFGPGAEQTDDRQFKLNIAH